VWSACLPLEALARFEDRDQDVGEHVAGEEDATVGEEDRGVADGVPGTGPPSAGSGATSATSSSGTSVALASFGCVKATTEPDVRDLPLNTGRLV
jgi:hypothetical protein